MEIKRISITPGFSLGSLGPLAISVWESDPRVEDALQAVQLLRNLAQTHPRIQVLAVLGADCRLPREQVREILGEGPKSLGSQVAAVAHVIEGEGFRGAALRGVLTGMGMVIRARYPQEAFRDIPSAAVFLAREGDLRAPSIVRGVAALRSVERM